MRVVFLLLAGLCLLAVNASAVDRYVNATNPSPVAPFIAWGNAARTIQDAVDVSAANDVIWVAAGTYNSGTRVVDGGMSNRVAVTVPVTVRSVSGPEVTFIVGAADPNWSYVIGCGSSAVRCVYLTSGASLIGFTLTNGHTRADGEINKERCGGGVYCYDHSATVSNCIIINCAGYQNGGGGELGVYRNCTISDNDAWNGGGAANAVLEDCTVSGNWSGSAGAGLNYCSVRGCTIVGNTCNSEGGGLASCNADRCLIQGNIASQRGGGVANGVTSNSLVIQNSAPGWRGGGGYETEFINCTVVANTSQDGGGMFNSTSVNSIVYYNTGTTANANMDPTSGATFSCVPGVAGTGNIAGAPQFMAGSYRLQPGSPCINKGTNLPPLFAAKDLDGRARIVRGIVDMGAYEFAGGVVNDYNANGVSDFPVFNPPEGAWYVRRITGPVVTWANQWGWSTAMPVVGDYNGDGKWDLAVFDTVGGYWYMKNVAGGTIAWANQWGWSTAKPVPGDYNGDGKWDQAVFDTVGGYWYIKNAAGGTITWANQWGWSTAKPVPGDYNGDGKWDLAVFDTVGGFWYIKNVAGGTITWANQWGWSTAKPVPGDYDGDGKWDLAVFDTAGGFWYIKKVTGQVIAWANQWGWSTAKPVPGDYNGDGKYDLALYDMATGLWYVKSLDGSVLAWASQWGWPGATIPAVEAAQ